MKLVATASGWRAGSLLAGSRRMSSIRRALRCPTSTSGTDRLDAAILMRVFLGWLRGERGHCGMVAIPTMEEEDARRPNRERESLVNERSRIVNRMKSARTGPRRPLNLKKDGRCATAEGGSPPQ